jgi:hypothetical protein
VFVFSFLGKGKTLGHEMCLMLGHLWMGWVFLWAAAVAIVIIILYHTAYFLPFAEFEISLLK